MPTIFNRNPNFQGCRIPSRPMICNYSSQIITNDQPQTATIIVDDSEAENDWPLLVNCLRSEKLKLAQSLHAMMAEKESLAMSLEGIVLFVCLLDFLKRHLIFVSSFSIPCKKYEQNLKSVDQSCT